MRLVLTVALPAHVIVVDKLGVGRGFPRRVEHEVEEGFAAQRPSDVGVANEASLGLHRLIHDVIGVDARSVALADSFDMIRQQQLSL